MGAGRPTNIWPLVGRQRELAEVARLRAEGVSGVALFGSAGVGKSRIAREAVAAAQQGGALTEWIQATNSAATVPLGALTGLLAGVRADQPFELLRSASAVLRERAAGRPVVVGVDDGHLLDPASASLVLHLVTTGSAFVIVTVRTGETCPDAIVSLWKDAGVVRMTVGELDEDETAALVEEALGGPLEQAARRWAYESSRGNVLYVRELLLGALADGSLVEDGGLWRMPRRPAPSESLVEMISSRLAELGDDERRAAELLALGEPLPLSELVELVGSDAVEKAESRAIAVVTPQPPHEVRVAHPLVSEVMRSQVPVVRARSARVRLASVLQRRERHTPDDALRIARLLLDAGETIPRDVLVEAAGAANVSGDPDLGAMLASRAIAEGAGWKAAAVLARAHFVRKRFEEAEIVLAGQEEAIDSPDDAIEYLEQRVPLLYWGLKRPAEALAALDRAAAWWPGEEWARRLLPLRLHVVAFTGDFGAAVPAGEELLGDDGLDPETRALLVPIQTTNLFYSGRGREAAALARTIRRAPPLRDQSDALAFMVSANMNVETGIGWDDLDPWLERGLANAVRYEDEEAAGIAALALGCIAQLRARYADAARWLVEATVHFERSDVFGATVVARGALVGVALMTGDAERAAREHRLCHAALDGHDPLPNQRPWVVRADGWAAAAQGDTRGAAARLLEGAAEHGSMPLLATQLSHEAMLLGAPARSIAASLEELRPRVDAPLGTAFADHARALADRDGKALMACADAFAAIGARRHESACAADAARVFLDAGMRDSARRAVARCRDVLPDGQGAVAPVIDGLDGVAVDLTTRERQLVDYAARGLSNAEIAEQLVLSVRTVETHLYRAMHKLGVSDRRELRGRLTS